MKQLTDEQLLRYHEGMFVDSEGIDCFEKKVVRTRKPHSCPGLKHDDFHELPAGSRAVVEHAIVDGSWRTAYTCEAHVIEWAKECGEIPGGEGQVDER
jgi:hypothetical protein